MTRLDFDPVYSTPLEEAAARFISEHYALAAPVDCRMLNRGFNDIYLVKAAEDRYVFRLSHRRARGAADVATETAFLAHLDWMRVPVAAPIPTRAGALFVHGLSPEGLRQGVLFRALDGRAPDPNSAADARANGATLAMVHEAAKSFSAASPLYRLDLDHLLRKPLARIRESGTFESDAASADLEATASRVAKAIESLDLTWTHCHGDCHGFNARMTGAGVAAFFDFDDGGPGYLAYDVAVFLWAKVSFGRRLQAMWRAFIEGYRTVRLLAPNDFGAVHAFVIVRHIWLMGEYASRGREWGSESIQWIARETEFLKAWEAEQIVERLL